MDETTWIEWAILGSWHLFQYPMLTYDRFIANFKEHVITERIKKMGLLRCSFSCDYDIQMTAGHCTDYRDDVFWCNICWRKRSSLDPD